MKAAILIVVCVMLVYSAGQAQTNPQSSVRTTEEKAAWQTDMMQEKLTLTDTIADKVGEINLKYIREAEIIRAKGRTRSTMQALREMSRRKDKELQGILDADTFQKYLVLKEEMRQKMGERQQQ